MNKEEVIKRYEALCNGADKIIIDAIQAFMKYHEDNRDVIAEVIKQRAQVEGDTAEQEAVERSSVAILAFAVANMEDARDRLDVLSKVSMIAGRIGKDWDWAYKQFKQAGLEVEMLKKEKMGVQ